MNKQSAKKSANTLQSSKQSNKKKTMMMNMDKSNKTMKAKGKSKKNTTTKPKDIIDLILKDHIPLKELIAVLKNPDTEFSTKHRAFNEFAPLFTSHAESEQKSLYSRMKDENALREEAFEGDVEHALATQLIDEVQNSMDDQDQWMAKVKVLAEIVEHHIDEEETEMFKKVKKEFDAETRYVMGQEYLNFHSEFEPDQEHTKSDRNKKPTEIRAH